MESLHVVVEDLIALPQAHRTVHSKEKIGIIEAPLDCLMESGPVYVARFGLSNHHNTHIRGLAYVDISPTEYVHIPVVAENNQELIPFVGTASPLIANEAQTAT